MAKFMVYPGTLHTQANMIAACEGSLKRLSLNVNQVCGRLAFSSSSTPVLQHSLRSCASDIRQEGHQADLLASALIQILKSYQKADEQAMLYSIRGAGDLSRKGISEVSTREKENIINNFERDHPSETNSLNAFLATGKHNNLTNTDIQNIKYLLYTAPEPFRSQYLKNLDKIQIGDGNLADGGAYYRPSMRTVNYSYPDCFQNDPRGPYTVFFHEYGHGIDDVTDFSKKIGSDTENYKAYSGKLEREVTVREAIEYDVYYNQDNPHSMTSIANHIKSTGGSGKDGNVTNVINAIQNGRKKGLNKQDKKLYNAVVNEYKRTTGNDERYEAVTDVYGGVSKNVLRNGGYGHDADYWDDSTMVGKELWAEYYSYNMAGDSENLNLLREYYPEASKVLDHYVLDIGR